MAILRPFLLPTAGENTEVKTSPRSSMLDSEFYNNQRRKRPTRLAPKILGPDQSKVPEGFIQSPQTGDHFEAQIGRLENAAPIPKPQPGQRVRAADIGKVSADNFQPYYDQLKSIGQMGEEQVGKAKAIAAFRRLQELTALNATASTPIPNTNQGSGGAAQQGRFAGTGNVGQWINEAANTLAQHGIRLSDQDKHWVSIMIDRESGGNPNAINLWDSNAKAGIPSKGLMQTIDPTFNNNKLPGFDQIYNPVHNIIAGVRYALRRYGSIGNVPGIRNLNTGRGYVGY